MAIASTTRPGPEPMHGGPGMAACDLILALNTWKHGCGLVMKMTVIHVPTVIVKPPMSERKAVAGGPGILEKTAGTMPIGRRGIFA